MAHAGAPRPARTAGAVIALANKELNSAWADRVRDASPEAKPEATEAAIAAPEPMEYMEAEGGPSSAVSTPKAPGTPKITLRIRSQATTPAVAATEHEREPEPEPTRAGRPRRAAANGKKAPAKPAKAAPKKRATRGRKRKASDDDESEAEESEDELPSRRNGRRSSPPPAPTGRVLRSRAAKPNLREPSSELSADEE